ncbi:insulin gene enhancer protein ISL-1 [Tetranychus urticae]|nr:insulin gene enhancer protein ISL-1 [Tetranychus urticae]
MKMVSCEGCGQPIKDRFLDKILDRAWHTYCVVCFDCKSELTEKCYSREGKLFCKQDFFKRFGKKCARCSQAIFPEDYVRWARNSVYHIRCFTCVDCHKELLTGDELYIINEDQLFCKRDYLASSQQSHVKDELMQPELSMSPPDSMSLNQSDLSMNQSDLSTLPSSTTDHLTGSVLPTGDLTTVVSPADSLPESVGHRRVSVVRPTSGHKQSSSEHKPTRVRTVLNEKQLTTLRSCYNANPRPDALLKERLVEMTGLSPRVIRVWFQNKRCKDKKKQIMMKQIQQQEKDGRQLQSIANMQGVPLVATSPVQHEIPHPIEVQSYHPPWKTLVDYKQIQSDCDQDDPHLGQHIDVNYHCPLHV